MISGATPGCPFSCSLNLSPSKVLIGTSCLTERIKVSLYFIEELFQIRLNVLVLLCRELLVQLGPVSEGYVLQERLDKSPFLCVTLWDVFLLVIIRQDLIDPDESQTVSKKGVVEELEFACFRSVSWR